MMDGAIFCNRCGTQNSALARFCANCGSPFSPNAEPVTPPAEISPRPQGPASQVEAPVYAAPAAVVRYGGFWIRVVAALIDWFIVSLVVWPVSAMIALAIGVAGGAVSMPIVGVHFVKGVVALTLSIGANWIYEASMESSSRQATLGKMALALKVTDLQGRRISFARATARHFAKILSAMILLIGYLMVGFTERKQGLHDMIAGTLVIRSL